MTFAISTFLPLFQKLNYVNDLFLSKPYIRDTPLFFYPILLLQICLLSHGKDTPPLCNVILCLLQALLNLSTLDFNLKPQPTKLLLIQWDEQLLPPWVPIYATHKLFIPFSFLNVVSGTFYFVFWKVPSGIENLEHNSRNYFLEYIFYILETTF